MLMEAFWWHLMFIKNFTNFKSLMLYHTFKFQSYSVLCDVLWDLNGNWALQMMPPDKLKNIWYD